MNTNGTAFGNLASIEIDKEGFVTAIFDNSVTRRIAQVAIATFANPDGRKAWQLIDAAGCRGLRIGGAHHERLDGKGYPHGLAEQQISVYGRMISIVDTYDAITSQRCYKEGQTGISALKILKRESPQSFDPVLLAQFIKAIAIHPVGTLVKLNNEKLGIVIKSNELDPLRPVIKVFYNCKFKRYIEISIVDLASNKVDLEIEGAVMPEDFGIDMIRFFRQSVLE